MSPPPSSVADQARPRPGLSVRARITAAVAALVAAALTVTGLIIYAVETARVDEGIEQAVDQEIAEFVALMEEGTDPATGDPFASAEALLTLFLERNLPGEHELLVGWVEGRAKLLSAGDHRGLVDEPAFVEAVPDLVASGSDTVIETREHGRVRLSVQPIQVDDRRDAGLVVAVLQDDARSELGQLMRTYVLVAILSFAAIVALAAWRAGGLLAPIRELNEAARRISASDLSARIPASGNDDLSDLTRTTNDMLDRLEASFVAQRQFLDDAGHELKTPLTVLRGHLELLEHADADEVAETRELLLDEVDRMSRLVQDLILLAKSARPDFLLPAEVDLDHLVPTLLAKCRALGDRAWTLDEVAHVRAHLDEQRITQAVLQLADNAVKHTDPGDEIALGCAREGDDLVLWVRDAGDGIPPEHRAAVLERFGRSGVRAGDEGFGLGLSIVSAIARAHGGRVHIDDADPDDPLAPGTRVEIRLPEEGLAWHRS